MAKTKTTVAASGIALAAVLGLLVLCSQAHGQSREVTYNYTPLYTLGKELWTLPVGGPGLTLSLDGKRLLISSLADSCFYLVDIEQARVIRKLSPKYFSGKWGLPFLQVDNNLKWMTIGDILWDIEADTLINVLPPNHYVRGVSSALNRVYAYSDSSIGDELINGLTMEVINQYPDNSFGKGCWFDDEAGVFYAGDHGSPDIYDAITGEYLRSSPVGGSYGGMVRRSAGSDWVFYFGMLSSNGLGPLVNAAANLKTKEHVTMDDVLPVGHYQGWYFMATSGDVAYQSIGRDAWKFDPAAATCQLLIRQPYFYYGKVPYPSIKNYIIDPQFRWYIHSWSTSIKDSAVLRCSELVPVATGVPATSVSLPPWLVVTPLMLSVSLAEAVVRVEIRATDGRLVEQQSGGGDAAPVHVPIGALPSGLYLCSVVTAMATHSASFTIVR